jgi:hypothetical protein
MRYLMSKILFLFVFLFFIGFQPAFALDINFYAGYGSGYSPWSYGGFGFGYGTWLGLGYSGYGMGYGGSYYFGFPRYFSYSTYPGYTLYAPGAVSYPHSLIPMIERQVEEKRRNYYGLKNAAKILVKKDEKEFQDFEKMLPEIKSAPVIENAPTSDNATPATPTITAPPK